MNELPSVSIYEIGIIVLIILVIVGLVIGMIRRACSFIMGIITIGIILFVGAVILFMVL